MFNLDPGKLLIIGVVAIILLGPDRLPQVARQVGGAWRSFNDFRHRMESEVRGSIPDLPSSSDIARLARSPTALLNHLSNMGTEGEASTAVAGVTRSGAADDETLPDGAPIMPFPPTGSPTSSSAIPTPAPRPAPAEAHRPEVILPGDPSLN
jgi:sec-independent protein translocase protein TatB